MQGPARQPGFDATPPKPLASVADVASRVVRMGVAPVAVAGFATPTGAFVGGAVDERAGEGAPLEVRDPAQIMFDLASLTKPLLALALAHSGLDRRTPLAEVLPEARGTASATVSLELLLAHRAGLEANLPIFEWVRMAGDMPAARSVALARAAEARREGCVGSVPPSGFDALYSDLGYVLVGEAAARALGVVDAGALIERFVALPLGLADELGTARGLLARGVDVERRAAPTELAAWRGGVVRGRVHDENAWMLTGAGGSGHAGMFGTAAAVLAFGQYVLAHRDAFAWTHEPRAGGTLRAGFDGKSPEGSSAGERMGARAFGHLGFTGTSVWIDPDLDRVVTLLTNRVYPTRDNLAIRAARPRAHDELLAVAEGAP